MSEAAALMRQEEKSCRIAQTMTFRHLYATICRRMRRISSRKGLHLAAHRPAMESLLFSCIGGRSHNRLLVMRVAPAKGNQRMATKAIVKRLSSIHDVGAMDILCVDKTGTLTSR